MARYERVLDLLPSFFAARRPSLLREVVRELMLPVDEADTHLFRIQRSHRVLLAEHADDLVRLAAALNLNPFHFEDVLAARGVPYERRLEVVRERVRRVARVHLDGLGTPSALLEAAAVFLNARAVASASDGSLVQFVDASHFSSEAIVEFPWGPPDARARITLHEHPIRRSKVAPADRHDLDTWTVNNAAVEPARMRVVVEGVADRTVVPALFCPSAATGLWFNGVVPAGSTLMIDDGAGATLDGRPIDDWVVHFAGGVYEFADWDAARYVVETGGDQPPFDGDFERLVVPPFQRPALVPSVPVGTSQWYFTVASGIADGASFDYSVSAPPDLPVGVFDADQAFDAAAYEYPANGRVGMAWNERMPCAFKLIVPRRIPALAAAADAPWVDIDLGRLGKLVPRFKPAGVRAFLDTARDAWVLGEAVLRDAAAADGAGIDTHPTTVGDRDAELLVPFDPDTRPEVNLHG